MEIPGGGSSGAEGPGGCLQRIGELQGGGAKFFFFGAEMSTKNKTTTGLVTGIGLKLRQKTPKGQMVPFSRGHLLFFGNGEGAFFEEERRDGAQGLGGCLHGGGG